jgi:hypothetical protein
MRKAGVKPKAATVRADSPELRAIAGPAAKRIAPVARTARPAGSASAALPSAKGTGRSAAAMSAGFRGRGRRR